MTIEDTLRKADTVLDLIIKYDEQNSKCSFQDFLQEIIKRWRSEKHQSHDLQQERHQPIPEHKQKEAYLVDGY